MYAIVALAGKQYHLESGQEVDVELTDELKKVEEGGNYAIKSVLFINKEGATQIGTPTISGAEVKVKVAKHGKGKKIRVETYKKRKGYKRAYGHRQPFVRLAVEEIVSGS